MNRWIWITPIPDAVFIDGRAIRFRSPHKKQRRCSPSPERFPPDAQSQAVVLPPFPLLPVSHALPAPSPIHTCPFACCRSTHPPLGRRRGGTASGPGWGPAHTLPAVPLAGGARLAGAAGLYLWLFRPSAGEEQGNGGACHPCVPPCSAGSAS